MEDTEADTDTEVMVADTEDTAAVDTEEIMDVADTVDMVGMDEEATTKE